MCYFQFHVALLCATFNSMLCSRYLDFSLVLVKVMHKIQNLSEVRVVEQGKFPLRGVVTPPPFNHTHLVPVLPLPLPLQLLKPSFKLSEVNG